MAYDLYQGDRQDRRAYVTHLLDMFHNVRTRRSSFEAGWEEAASICWPEYRNSFTFGHMRTPGAKMSQFQLTSAGARASHRFMAIADTMLTPAMMLWSRYVPAGNERERAYLMRQPGVKQYFSDLTMTAWQYRYRHEAGFIGANQSNMQALGVFGNMNMLTYELDGAYMGLDPGLRYVPASPGEIYYLENHQRYIDGYIRHFRWTARQALRKWGEACPREVKLAHDRNSQERFDFLEFVMPNSEYDERAIFSSKGKRWTSCIVSVAGSAIVEEGGYRTMPLAPGRYSQAPEETEGRGPAQAVLGELKTLNAEVGMFLRQGHFAADPVWLLPEDSAIDFQAVPGSYAFGGMVDGKPTVGRAEAGNIQITEEMMKMSEAAVNDAFLVSLYPVLFARDEGTRQRGAREVVEFASDRGVFLAPLGRQISEYLGPLCYRELDILAYQGLLPDAPPVLREAGVNYSLQACGPLARMMQAQTVAGFMRTLEMAANAAQKTGDPSVMFHFNLDEALPDIADLEFAPPRWMSTPQQVQQKRVAAARQAERERQVKEMPGRAAIMKAQAISDKAQAGMNTGGTLSGTMEGGMPMMPGQSEPGGRPYP